MSNATTSPHIAGLTGRIASGKSTVAKEFQRLGATIISADDIVKQLYTKNTHVQTAVTALFSPHNVREQNSQHIDINKLKPLLLQKPTLLNALERIIFPAVYRATQGKLNLIQQHSSLIIIEAPLLFQGKLHQLCSKTIGCICPSAERFARAKARSNLSREVFNMFENRQLPETTLVSTCDYIINTAESLEHTYAHVNNIYNEIRTLDYARATGS